MELELAHEGIFRDWNMSKNTSLVDRRSAHPVVISATIRVVVTAKTTKRNTQQYQEVYTTPHGGVCKKNNLSPGKDMQLDLIQYGNPHSHNCLDTYPDAARNRKCLGVFFQDQRKRSFCGDTSDSKQGITASSESVQGRQLF